MDEGVGEFKKLDTDVWFIASLNLATDPSTLCRATQDRPFYALSSYAGQASHGPVFALASFRLR